MIPRGEVVARLRDAGFRFEGKKKRVELYRERGGLRHVVVPFRDILSIEEARIILGQAGLSKAQIEDFLKSCTKH